MKVVGRTIIALAASVAMVLGVSVSAQADTPAVDAAAATVLSMPVHDRAVSAVPAAWTPHIQDGRVFTLAQVGSTVIAGGSFSRVSQTATSTAMSRTSIVAFNATTGQISTSFNPSVVNGQVNAVIPGPIAGTVFVAGSFTSIAGVSRKVVLLNAATGRPVAGFTAPVINGQVRDLVLVGNRLYVGGTYTTVGGLVNRGLVTLNATSGARESFLSVDLTENHNFTSHPDGARGAVGARSIAVDANATTLAVIGNFRKADGLTRDQMVLIDITGTTAQVRSDWRTRRYEPACAWRSFDSYMRDITASPDGSYFTVATTGAPNTGTLCDTLVRWDVDASGDNVQPIWYDETGGDTLLSAASSGAVVYTGGHQRWQNNANGADYPAAGSVPRPGIAGFHPDWGLPIEWNPGRNPRGAGAEALLVTTAGLWVGSDTVWIGDRDYRRSRLAFFPVQSGQPLPEGSTGDLPSNVYLGAAAASPPLSRIWYEGGAAQHDLESAPAGDVDWSRVGGAVVIDGMLYYLEGGSFLKRSFNGVSYGPEEVVDPYNDPKWANVDTGSGGTYRGALPSFYGQMGGVRGLEFEDGLLYYTRAGFNQIFVRKFVPGGDVMSQAVGSVPGFSQSSLGGIFIDAEGGYLYFSNSSTGTLSRIAWNSGSVSGAPRVVSGPAIDGMNWRAGAMFLADGPAPQVNQPPAATFDISCERLECTFDVSDSSDPDGSIVGYSWDFGDGSADGTGIAPDHTYSEAGEYEVTLTVQDNSGAVAEASTVVDVSDVVTEAPELVGFNTTNTHSQRSTVAVPAGVEVGDVLLLLVNSATVDPVVQPTGAGTWQLVEDRVSGPMSVRVFAHEVDGSEGASVSFAWSALRKVDLTILAYRNADLSGLEIAETVGTNQTSHTSPEVDAEPGQVAVSYWADRGSNALTWTAPAGVNVISTQVGSGSGRVSSLVADAEVTSAGTYGGLVATTSAVASRTVYLTLLLPAQG